MNYRTPLNRVRGLGSAKEGSGHWWVQRLTAVALVPLTLWFVISVLMLIGADQAAVRDWLSGPLAAVLMVVLIAATFHHGQLGLQVVIEDYVHNKAAKTVMIVLVKFAALLLALLSIFAVLRLAFGG